MRKNNMNCQPSQFGFTIVAAFALACSVSGTAHAGPEDALNFVVGTTATYDDNLFRSRAISGSTSRSDMIYTAYAGVRVDKSYSLQRFQLDLTGTRYEYQSNDFLNFSAVDYRAAWLWSLTPSLTGVVSAERSEMPTNYADFTNQSRRNVQTSETMRLLADWAVSGSWHITGGAYQTELKNSGGFTEVGSYVQDTAEAGIKYVSAANTSIAVVHRESHGEYHDRTLVNDGNLLDTGYDQSETELRAIWRITGHSSLDTRLGYLDRTHEHYAQRDYSGAVGRLSYLWMPTGKLQFTLAAGRDLYSYQSASSSYYSYDYLSLIPAWLVSDKTTIRLKLDLGKRDYRGSLINAPTREDIFRAAQLSVAWRPTPTIDIGAQLTREERSSTNGGLSYHDNIAGISAALKF